MRALPTPQQLRYLLALDEFSISAARGSFAR